jgi:hypothetical protein
LTAYTTDGAARGSRGSRSDEACSTAAVAPGRLVAASHLRALRDPSTFASGADLVPPEHQFSLGLLALSHCFRPLPLFYLSRPVAVAPVLVAPAPAFAPLPRRRSRRDAPDVTRSRPRSRRASIREARRSRKRRREYDRDAPSGTRRRASVPPLRLRHAPGRRRRRR